MASSVDCERGFSVQNHIKTKTRNILASKHLDVLMRVRLLGGRAEDFPFEKAWIHSKKRRTRRETEPAADFSDSNSESDYSDSE